MYEGCWQATKVPWSTSPAQCSLATVLSAGMGWGTQRTRENPIGAYWPGSMDSIKVKCRVTRDAKELINTTLTLDLLRKPVWERWVQMCYRVRRYLLFAGTWNLMASTLESYSTNQNKWCLFVCLFVYNCAGLKLGAVIVRSMAYSLLLFHPL